SGFFDVIEKGSVDEYNIALGGNIANKVFWGMNFDIINMDYRLQSLWEESLDNAWVYNPDTRNLEQTGSNWNMQNLYRANGSGFNYQLGVIVKPVQELRIGLAAHTPTWYNLTETFSADIMGKYYGHTYNPMTNNGAPAYNDVNFRTPWKIIASVAGVIGSKFIVSADYEWQAFQHMKFSEPSYNDYYYDYYAMPGSPFNPDLYADTNADIKDYYQQTNTFRLGAEYRVTPRFSVRAGYSIVSSPVRSAAKENRVNIITAGTMPNYRFDNTTNYVTCGLGYKISGFYVDLAYVYKHMSSEYHAFSPDPSTSVVSPQAQLSLNNSQVVLSCGLKF
ncbi:MAG: outer membrane protein transport protein, partial [Muribaculaceae bacterium]|nr:outer membrane protein transport protein [Muribaculaceae bacterium]